MGRPRKKVEEPEETIIIDEDPPPKNARRVVNAKHTITYTEPLPVPAVEGDDDEDEELADDTDDEESADNPEELEARSKKRAQPSFRTKLKKKLADLGIGGGEQLKLRVDRLPYYHVDGRSGLHAEKEFVRIFTCQEKYILEEDYLEDVAKMYGPGAYQFTLRHGTAILRSWPKVISGPAIAPTATAQPAEASAQSPAQSSPMSYAPPPGQQFPPAAPPPPPRSLKQELKELIETQRLMRELNGGPSAEPAPALPPDPEVTLLTMLAKDESVMSRLTKGLLGKVLGNSAEERNEWAEIVMEVIKSGQAPQIISATINSFFSGFSNLIPKGTNNGPSQMGAPPLADRAQGASGQSQNHTDQSEVPGGQTEIGETPSQVLPPGDPQSAPSPEDQLLNFVLDQCARRVPPAVVVDRIFRFAEEVNIKAPAQSVDGYIQLFALLSPEEVLQFVRSLPGAEQIANLPHAGDWTMELQQALQKELSAGEEGAE